MRSWQVLQKGSTGSTGSANPSTSKKTVAQLAQEVIDGKWGNGSARKNALEKAGYDYEAVQAEVNKKLGVSTSSKKKVTDTIVDAVIRGDYGNGASRKKKLEAAGYDYEEVQAAVNKKLS